MLEQNIESDKTTPPIIFHEVEREDLGIRISCSLTPEDMRLYDSLFIIGQEKKAVIYLGASDIVNHFFSVTLYVKNTFNGNEIKIANGSFEYVIDTIQKAVRTSGNNYKAFWMDDSENKVEIESPFELFVTARSLAVKLKEEAYGIFKRIVEAIEKSDPEKFSLAQKKNIREYDSVHSLLMSGVYPSFNLMYYFSQVGLITQTDGDDDNTVFTLKDPHTEKRVLH